MARNKLFTPEFKALVKSEARSGAAHQLQALLDNAKPGSMWGEDTTVDGPEWIFVKSEVQKIIDSLMK